MNDDNSFAPTIIVNGETITPKGYEWVLGFALHGCEWAIKEDSKPEFLNTMRGLLADEKLEKLEALIQTYKDSIAELEVNRASILKNKGANT